MELKCKLQTFLIQNLKKISETNKKIEYFIHILDHIERIINEDELEFLLDYPRSVIKNEFLKNFYSNILNEILFNFNHPDLFTQNDRLDEVKRLLTSIIVQVNYEDSFRVLLKLSSSLK